jgi:hypothetical protein
VGEFKIEDLPFEEMTPQERRIWWARCLVTTQQASLRAREEKSFERKWTADPANPEEWNRACQEHMSSTFMLSFYRDDLRRSQERLAALEAGEEIGNDPGPDLLHEFVKVNELMEQLKREWDAIK